MCASVCSCDCGGVVRLHVYVSACEHHRTHLGAVPQVAPTLFFQTGVGRRLLQDWKLLSELI